MRCRCSIRPASSPSTTGPATNAGLFDVSHMGQAFLVGPDHRDSGRAHGKAGAGRHRGPRASAASATRSSRTRRRHHRRSDDHPLATRAMTAGSISSSMPRARTSTTPGSRSICPMACEARSAADDRALLALQGPKAGRRSGAPLSRAVRDLAFMITTRAAIRRHRLPCLALGLYRRGRLRDFGLRPRMRRGSGETLLAEPEVKPIGLGARDSLQPRSRPVPLWP